MAKSNIRIKKICEWCGQEFVAQKVTTKYCSHRCANLAYKQAIRAKRIQQEEQRIQITRSEKPLMNIRDKEYLSIAQAATLLGLSLQAVYKMIYTGHLVAYKLSSRLSFVRQSDIEEMLKRNPYRKLQSDQFTIQTVGRILRMPEQKHYPKEQLNIGYVYTDIAKDKIQIVTADSDYILKNTITACRRENLENVSLPAYYSERPNVERNYLGPDFKKTLYEVADEFWKLERGAGLFSIAELAALRNDNDEFTPLPESDDDLVNENRRRVKNSIRLDVKTINVEIPKDVHFQNEEQILKVDQVRFARKASEIDRVFMAYISGKGHQFESKGRADKIANYLLEMLADYFGIFDTDAKKVVLYYDNRPKFDRLLDTALETYARKRERAKKRSAAARELK